MKSITATRARQNLFKLIKKQSKETEPILITGKNGDVVLLSAEEYESLLETAELMAVPGLFDSIKQADKEIEEGEVIPFDEVFKGNK